MKMSRRLVSILGLLLVGTIGGFMGTDRQIYPSAWAAPAPREVRVTQRAQANTLNTRSLSVTDRVVQDRYWNYWSYYTSVPYLKANDATSEQYPALARRLESLNEDSVKVSKVNAQRFEQDLKYAHAEAREHKERIVPLFSCYNEQVSVSRLDKAACGLLYQSLFDNGGAHADNFCHAVNFDPRTGADINLSDLVSDMSALEKYVAAALEAKYPDADFIDHRETLHAIFSATPQDKYYERQNSCWIITARGIEFRFNHYELASYKDGRLSVYIDSKDHPELFKKKAVERYFKSESSAHGDKALIPMLPQQLGELVGKWQMVSSEVDGDNRTVDDSGLKCEIDFKDNGIASFILIDNNGNEHRANYLRVKVVEKPLYYDCPNSAWSAVLLDEDCINEHRVGLFPDGTLHLFLEQHAAKEEYPAVMHGVFKRMER